MPDCTSCFVIACMKYPVCDSVHEVSVAFKQLLPHDCKLLQCWKQVCWRTFGSVRLNGWFKRIVCQNVLNFWKLELYLCEHFALTIASFTPDHAAAVPCKSLTTLNTCHFGWQHWTSLSLVICKRSHLSSNQSTIWILVCIDAVLTGCISMVNADSSKYRACLQIQT